jgi:monofunctional biosynthetic peptidoglycan transglycosylase
MKVVSLISRLKKLEHRLKNKVFFQVARYVIVVLAALNAFAVILVIGLNFVQPPVTWLMVKRWIENGHSPHYRPVKYDHISVYLKKAVITAEDHRFMKHHGFDFKEIERAERRNNQKKSSGKPIAGASTLTQQVAKNVFLWPGRSYVRKALEMYFTVLVESYWSKQWVLQTYLNIAELGPGIYGVDAAAKHYFKTNSHKITKKQAVAIAAILPSPLKWSPINPHARVKRRITAINRYLAFADIP